MRLRTVLIAATATVALASLAPAARAQDPGLAYPATSEMSDTKLGSVLFFNLYSSGIDPSVDETHFAITNGDGTNAQRVRIFLVDGATGSALSTPLCLGPNQTFGLNASQVDPGVRGWIIAVAVDVNGCPLGTEANVLSGLAHVKLAEGFRGTLPAVAVSSLFSGTLPGCDANSTTAALSFNGVSFNRLPRLASVDNFPSRADGTRQLLVVNRIAGNLGTTTSSIGKIVGNLWDDAESRHGYVMLAPASQLVAELMNGTPVTAPPMETVVSAGRTGWTRIRIFGGDIAHLGAVLFTPPNGAMNLPTSTLSAASSLTMPVSAPGC
ncbi:MAG TPA: hypothetical protein VFD92_03075 [Candidatus Binatia bacterium]|nr:hypothetical protein [Candidatus Binatia bacterium]